MKTAVKFVALLTFVTEVASLVHLCCATVLAVLDAVEAESGPDTDFAAPVLFVVKAESVADDYYENRVFQIVFVDHSFPGAAVVFFL